MTDASGWEARRIRASWSSVILALVTLVAVFVGRNVFVAATQPLGWVAAAAATAVVIAPVIELQARVVPRGVAIVSSLVVAVALALSLGVGVVVEIGDQLGELQDRLPAAAARIERTQGPDSVVAQIELASLVDDVVAQTAKRVSPAPTIEGAVGTVPAFLVSGILVIFFLVWGDELFEGLERQIAHPERRQVGSKGVQDAVRSAQGYMLSSGVVALAIAALGAGLSRLLGLPTPLVLGVVLGTASLIPRFGVLFGSVPLLLLAFAFESAWEIAAVALAVAVLQAGVTLVAQATERRTVRVGPAVIVIASLLGSDLYGIGGAIVAVVAGILLVALFDATVADDLVADDLRRS